MAVRPSHGLITTRASPGESSIVSQGIRPGALIMNSPESVVVASPIVVTRILVPGKRFPSIVPIVESNVSFVSKSRRPAIVLICGHPH
jgi:hypothetical protein